MANIFDFTGRRRIVSGEIIIVRARIEVPDNVEADRYLRSIAEEQRGTLQWEVSELVYKTLGMEFQLRSLSFEHGSLTILLIVGTTYYAISRYKNFVESIQLFVRQLTQLLSSFFGGRQQRPVLVSTSWSPGPGLVEAQTEQLRAPYAAAGWLLIYLVLSHAVMLGLIMWLLVTRIAH